MLLVGVLAASCGSAQSRQVGFHGLERDRIAGATEVVSSSAGVLSQLSVLVTVGTDGQVLDARVADNFAKLDPAPGLAAVRAWRFRPQRFEGEAVEAVGVVSVIYTLPADPADTKMPFPQGDPAATEIVLERGACFGPCPDYRVSVRGDGQVRFSTRRDGLAGTTADIHRRFNGQGVLIPGEHVARIDPLRAAALIERFRAAHFFGLKPAYEAGITDSSTYTLTVTVGSTTKRVVDYVGRGVGMPVSVTELEQAVDEVADTARWVDGNVGTVSWLEAAGFDFRSRQAAELAAAVVASGRDNPQASTLLRTLLDRGLPLATMVGQGRGRAAVGSMLVRWAASHGDEALFTRLGALGEVRRAEPRDLQAAFDAGAGCSPSIAQALVHSGANPKAAKEGSALIAVRGPNDACAEAGEARQVDMARTLIDLGVPLEARDWIDWTALMGCDSPELARLLLTRGANPNARDKDGTTAVMATDDDRVALLLLRAGANPRAKDANGTLRQQAVKQHMPATLAWLDAHGIP